MALIFEFWFLVGLIPTLLCLFINEWSSSPAVLLFSSDPIRLTANNVCMFLMAWTLWPIYAGLTIEWYWFGGMQKFNDKLREHMANKRRDNQ